MDHKDLDRLEQAYPGSRETLEHFESETLPACAHCGSARTASVQVGIVGRAIALAAATTKIKLIANGPKPGKFFCNDCERFFG